jgi:hypothetical protein
MTAKRTKVRRLEKMAAKLPEPPPVDPDAIPAGTWSLMPLGDRLRLLPIMETASDVDAAIAGMPADSHARFQAAQYLARALGPVDAAAVADAARHAIWLEIRSADMPPKPSIAVTDPVERNLCPPPRPSAWPGEVDLPDIPERYLSAELRGKVEKALAAYRTTAT